MGTTSCQQIILGPALLAARRYHPAMRAAGCGGVVISTVLGLLGVILSQDVDEDVEIPKTIWFLSLSIVESVICSCRMAWSSDASLSANTSARNMFKIASLAACLLRLRPSSWDNVYE